MTEYEKIKNMSVDQMAGFLYSFYEMIAKSMLGKHNISDIERNKRINKIKMSLLKEGNNCE